MNFEAAEKIANAVLYEGYILYPYRPSSTKNRQRWNFGTLYPQAFAEEQRPAEAFRLIAECLATTNAESTLDVRVRFLQLQPGGGEAEVQGWEEGVERTAERRSMRIEDLLGEPASFTLGFEGSHRVTGRLEVKAERVSEVTVKLHVELANVTERSGGTREAALPFAFTSAHVLLGLDGGEFLSLLDPPEALRLAAADCHNVGVFPVLAGEEGQRNIMLASPIILYDYPKVAPESAGDFFDGTEMDEMLSLRVLTMTDEEKQEMRSADARARSILDRTETLPAEHMMKLHGAIRGLRRVQHDTEEP